MKVKTFEEFLAESRHWQCYEQSYTLYNTEEKIDVCESRYYDNQLNKAICQHTAYLQYLQSEQFDNLRVPVCQKCGHPDQHKNCSVITLFVPYKRKTENGSSTKWKEEIRLCGSCIQHVGALIADYLPNLPESDV